MSTMSVLLLSLLTPACLASDPAYHQLSWFVHITDIHISELDWAAERTAQLEQFVTADLAVLQPEVVLCGGDLTEGVNRAHTAARQVPGEWRDYQRVTAARWKDVPWLDIRGNHDSLNVLGRNSGENMFKEYSVQGRQGNLHSYLVPWASRGQNINFVAVDATWELGMTYPFNFVGDLDQTELDILEGIKAKLKNSSAVNILFGHYPTATVQQSAYLRDLLLTSGLVYMSGHLHDLAFFKATSLYTFHGDREGLELELVDWKFNRGYRLFAVDHGTFSFVDLRFSSWPVALVTFPKDQLFWQPAREPLAGLMDGGKVRLLAFSDVTVTRVTLAVGDGPALEATAVSGGPLYTVPWEPASYRVGVHELTVTVTDVRNRTVTHRHSFTLSPEEAGAVDNWFPNLVLRSSFVTLFRVFFCLTLLTNLSVLAYFRLCYSPAWRCSGHRPWLTVGGVSSLSDRDCTVTLCRPCHWLARRLSLVAGHDRLFLPLLAFVLYMSCGPWVVGRLIEGRIGAIFAWGAVVQGSMVHTQTTYVFYCVHFAFVHPALVVVIGHVADWRVSRVTSRPRPTAASHALAAALLVLGMAANVYFSLSFWQQFGVLGVVVGPLRTWSHVFYTVMVAVAASLPREVVGRLEAARRAGGQKKTDGDVAVEEAEPLTP